MPVAIVLAIGGVVFLTVADDVHQRETVMGGDQVYRRGGLPGIVVELLR